MGFFSRLFGGKQSLQSEESLTSGHKASSSRDDQEGTKCGGCGQQIQNIEEATKDFGWQSMAARGDPLAEMQGLMSRMSSILTTPAYRCNQCQAITCRGCSRGDNACAKCGATDTKLILPSDPI
jgi:hypothetical protein